MVALLVLLLASLDPRLAAMTKVFVVADDQLADDRPVAACFAERLEAALPLARVERMEDADVVFVVRARLSSPLTRRVTGQVAGRGGAVLGNVRVFAVADQTKLWDGFAQVEARDARGEQDDACALADAGLASVRRMMRKARGK